MGILQKTGNYMKLHYITQNVYNLENQKHQCQGSTMEPCVELIFADMRRRTKARGAAAKGKVYIAVVEI